MDTIRTARLELVQVTTPFTATLVAGDRSAASAIVGARVGAWLIADSSHVVQLELAQQAGEAMGYGGLGRVIVLADGRRPRQVIGSIGFHGPPDDRGRLELGCRISPALRGHGYAAEAMTALLDWATVSFGITRFLVAVPSPREPRELVPVEMAGPTDVRADERVEVVAALVELETGAGGR